MEKRTKIILILAALPLIITVLYHFGLFAYIAKFYFPKMAKQGKNRRIILLYETDHVILLDACRKLIEEKYSDKIAIKKMERILDEIKN